MKHLTDHGKDSTMEAKATATVDLENDVAYINLTGGPIKHHSCKSRDAQVILDYAEDGSLIGIEVLW
jgi:uncharacterized protein YuzE